MFLFLAIVSASMGYFNVEFDDIRLYIEHSAIDNVESILLD